MDDPAPPFVRVIEENESFVRALARSLVADEHTADDLTQDALIIALEHPPEHFRNVRAWLGTVIEHLAGRRRLATARRTAREAATARAEAHPGSIETLAWQDTLRRVRSAVLALEEPYQATILLRYSEGLSATEIAGRMNVTASTVRGRLQRALARLRVILDQKSGGDREAWIRGLLPVIGGKSGSVGAGGAVATLGGAMVIGTTVKVAVVVAATASIGALGWWGISVIGPPRRVESALASSLMPVVALNSEVAFDAPTLREPVMIQDSTRESALPTRSPQGGGSKLSEEEELARLYSTLSVEELERERERISAEVSKVAHPIMQQRLDAGIYEVLGLGNEYTPPKGEDPWILRSIAFIPTNGGTEIRRVELLEPEYPELYGKLRVAKWLAAQARGKRLALLKSAREGR